MYRIALLEADELREEFVAQYQSIGQMFIELIHQAEPTITFETFIVHQQEFPKSLKDFDAILVSGSRADSFADEPWIKDLSKLIQQAFDTNIPILAVCFGHQLTAITLGGHAQRAEKGWTVGNINHELLVRPDWMQGDLTDFSLLSVHQDQVSHLPKDAVHLAKNEPCEYAAYWIPKKVLSFQGHPEFDRPFSAQLWTLIEEKIGAGLLKEALDSLEKRSPWFINCAMDGEFFKRCTSG